jgi:hypothetical protein
MTVVSEMVENPYAGQGAVLLDIGGDVGALVVGMPVAMEGVEVEIRATDPHRRGHSHGHRHGTGSGDHEHHPHVAVVSRPVRGTTVPSLVFGELVEGDYELYEKGHQHDVRLVVHVVGGEVVEATWPE